MQVRKANSCIPWCQPFIFLLKDTPSCTLMFVCCLAFSNYCLLFVATHQQLLALYEVPQPGMSLELRWSRARGSRKGRFHWSWAVLLRVLELQCPFGRRKDTILRTCRGITRGWIWTIRLTIDTERPYCNLGGWTVFTVTALVALASFLCVLCSFPSHRGFGILSNGWRVWEEAACAEMLRWNCTKPQCKGMSGKESN